MLSLSCISSVVACKLLDFGQSGALPSTYAWSSHATSNANLQECSLLNVLFQWTSGEILVCGQADDESARVVSAINSLCSSSLPLSS